jgi:hypothetical protein
MYKLWDFLGTMKLESHFYPISGLHLATDFHLSTTRPMIQLGLEGREGTRWLTASLRRREGQGLGGTKRMMRR